MNTIHEAQRYLNGIANLLSIVDSFPLQTNLLYSAEGYEAIAERTHAQFIHAWGCGVPTFFSFLDNFISSLNTLDNNCFVSAAAAAMWMDSRISYEEKVGNEHISLYSLVPQCGDRPVFVDKLNTNDRESGIQIHPKFEVYKVLNKNADKQVPFSNRDVFYGINGQLNHICYIKYDEHQVIHNVVIPYEFVKENDTFRVAFCPLSDDPNILKMDNQQTVFKGITMAGRRLQSIHNSTLLVSRFENDMLMACKEHADLVFFPEMLGFQELEEESAGYNLKLFELFLDVIEKSKEPESDLKPPILTFLPSWWREGINSTTVVYQSGAILGVQRKYIPYVNMKENWVEALQEEEIKHLLVIHIPGIHRIVAVICAEFQPLREHMAKVLCGGLGATLIIVPAFSKGEQDFINSLPTLKDYGVTVIWGNCCSATKKPRVIGGCSIAGLDEIQRFGSTCKCNYSCEGNSSCIFMVSLPLSLSREKPFSPIWESPIEHILLS